MAQSRESLWLWVGSAAVAVGAALAGVAGAFAATQAHYRLWSSTPMIAAYTAAGLAIACFAGAVRNWPFPFSANLPQHSHQSISKTPDPAHYDAAQAADGNNNSGITDSGIRITTGEIAPRALSPNLPTRVVVGDVPQQPPAFQTRDAMLARLREGDAVQAPCAINSITGMRGTGKTQLAATFARQCIIDGWRLVAWINADDSATTLDGLSQVAAALGIPPEDKQIATARVLRHMLETDGTRCLLVFDNVTSLDLIRPYLPAVGPARVLITSTNQATGSLGVHLPVDVFTQQEALDYLRERTGRDDESAAREVADELSHLPLALAQAAAVIRSQHLTYGTYLERLRALPIDEYLVPTGEDPYPDSTAAAILLSLKAAITADSTGLALPVINLTALLSPAGIPKDLLYTANSIDVPAKGPVGQSRSETRAQAEIDAALAHLATASLLTYSLSGSTVAAHQITTRVIREKLAREGDLPSEGARAIAVLDAATRTVEPLWQHQTAAKNLTQQITALHNHLESDPAATHLPASTSEDLLQLRGWALHSLGKLGDNPTLAVNIGKPLVADYAQLLGPEHPDALSVQGNLAYAYRLAGQLDEAIRLFEENLTTRIRIFGPDSLDTIMARGNLAQAYQLAGRRNDAIPLYERNFIDCQRTLGAHHSNTLIAVGDLAVAFLEDGRTDDAIPLLESVLDFRERGQGSKHPDTLTARNNLANAYRAAGRFDDSIQMFKSALADSGQLQGQDHPDTLTIRYNLAVTYRQSDRIAEAMATYESVLQDLDKILGPDHFLTRKARTDLAAVQVKAGRITNAIALYERNLSDCDRTPGPDRPETITARLELAATYQRVGQLDRAIALCEQAVIGAQRTFGQGNSLTIAAQRSLTALRNRRAKGQPNSLSGDHGAALEEP